VGIFREIDAWGAEQVVFWSEPAVGYRGIIVVHDTTHPADLIRAIRTALRDDGVWICADIRSFPTFEQNLAEHPMAALLYGFSVTVCMSSSMSTPDGAGLGTLGFNEQVARKMTRDADFSRFELLEYGNAMNAYYDIRP